MHKLDPIDKKSIGIWSQLNAKEYEIWQQLYRQSTCRNPSEYIRTVVLQKPVHIRYRNESLDEILEELADLRMNLKTVLQHIEERREELSLNETPAWNSSAMDFILEQELRPLIKQIFERISNFSDIWSRYSRVVKA